MTTDTNPGAQNAVNAWQPITDEVKDGRRILVSNDRGIFTVHWDADWCDGWWICPDGKFDDRPLRGSEPTLWQPTPTPPQEPTP